MLWLVTSFQIRQKLMGQNPLKMGQNLDDSTPSHNIHVLKMYATIHRIIQDTIKTAISKIKQVLICITVLCVEINHNL